jgi:hypothetical protein
MDVEELAANMSETGNFLDIAAPIKLLEASIAISMKPTRKGLEMISWPIASAI